jgi:hypothetical protein
MKKIIQKVTNTDLGTIILRCDDHCTMLVIDKTKYEYKNNPLEIDYNISMQDSSLDGFHNTFKQRIKRAFKVLLGKPIYYNDIYIKDEKQIIEFRDALTELINTNN